MSAASRMPSILLARCKNTGGFSRLTTISRQVQEPKKQQVRLMGSGGHMPAPQSMIAEFPAKRTYEAWEPYVFVLWPLILVMTVAVSSSLSDDCEAWAQQEARARLALKEQGFTNFQFGVHYQDLKANEIEQLWDEQNAKTTTMNDDDEDDDDE
jgi:hypothetical protein